MPWTPRSTEPIRAQLHSLETVGEMQRWQIRALHLLEDRYPGLRMVKRVGRRPDPERRRDLLEAFESFHQTHPKFTTIIERGAIVPEEQGHAAP